MDASRDVGALALVARALATDVGAGRTVLAHVDLTLAAGEICGVAGVDGNGQDELAEALAGAIPRRGTVVVHGTTLVPGDVAAALDAGWSSSRATAGVPDSPRRSPSGRTCASPPRSSRVSRTSVVSTSRAPAPSRPTWCAPITCGRRA